MLVDKDSKMTTLNKCRLCLRLGRFSSIFEEDDYVKFSEMVMAITDLEIEEGDGLPWHICNLCVESLSAAYVFRAQCLRADLHVRTYSPPEIKHSGSTLNASFSGLLNQDFHVNSQLDCSVPDYDESVDNNINKDIFAFNKPAPKPTEASSDEIEVNSAKCSYCHEPLVENTHKCGESSKQTSDSDETVIVADHIKKDVRFKNGNVKCILCDERYHSYEGYLSHLLECTANVRIQYYECSECRDITTSMKEYLQHMKRHLKAETIRSIDCVDATTKREDELMQTMAPAKPRREVAWTQDFLWRESGYPKHSSPAKESIRKLIQAGKDKTANYHCFGRGGKKLKKKIPKYKYTQARKSVERKLFGNEDTKPETIVTFIADSSNASKYYDALNESYSTISETSGDFATADEPIYATVEKKKIFMLSDFIKNRESIVRMLTELGVEVASNTGMEMRASHFVCCLPKDTCSGMMVCALATGKWLLHYTFVTDSYARGKLLEESAYDWAHHPRLTYMNATSEEAAKASEFWRLKLQAAVKKYPFQDSRVILMMERKYYKYYKFIFKACKARVIQYDKKDPDACLSATHCFVDMKSVQTSDLMFFANHNIPVYPYQYILIYLLKCGDVQDQHKYLLHDYKSMKESENRGNK